MKFTLVPMRRLISFLRCKSAIAALSCLMFFAVLSMQAVAQNADTTSNKITESRQQPKENEVDGEFNVFLFGMFFGSAILVLVGGIVGSIIAIMIILILIAFVTGGILSISAINALYRRSFTSGVVTAVYLALILAGVIGGIALSHISDYIWNWTSSSAYVWCVGAFAGFLGGLFTAWFTIWVSRKMWRSAKAWLNNRETRQ